MTGRPDIPAKSSLDPSASAALSAFRFFLALMVMAHHLSSSVAPQTGKAAVEAFFCISGFLITMIATGTYAGRPQAYLVNRFLRIYPIYWTCLLIALAIVFSLPASAQFNPSLRLPSTALQAVSNVAVWGLTQGSLSRLLPPAWSLHTELWFYLIIGLVTASRPRLTLTCAVTTVAFSTLCAAHIVPFQFYGYPMGNADAFFLGSLAWQFRNKISVPHPFAVLAVAVAGFATLDLGPVIVGPMVNIFAVPFVMPIALICLWQSRIAVSVSFHPFLNFLGKISYPMFLLHWPIAALFWNLAGIHMGRILFGLTTVATIAACSAIHFVVERHLDYIRDAIRGRRRFSAVPSTAEA